MEGREFNVQLKSYPELTKSYSDEALTAVEEIVAAFLAGMPELGIHADYPAEQKIVDEFYGGKASAYIWESFGNFLDQCIDEEEA